MEKGTSAEVKCNTMEFQEIQRNICKATSPRFSIPAKAHKPWKQIYELRTFQLLTYCGGFLCKGTFSTGFFGLVNEPAKPSKNVSHSIETILADQH